MRDNQGRWEVRMNPRVGKPTLSPCLVTSRTSERAVQTCSVVDGAGNPAEPLTFDSRLLTVNFTPQHILTNGGGDTVLVIGESSGPVRAGREGGQAPFFP